MKTRDGTKPPIAGYVRVYRLIDATMHEDVVAEAKRVFREKGWSVLEDATILGQETQWQEVVLWAIPPNREVE